MHVIARVLAPLLWVLPPATGRHRAGQAAPAVGRAARRECRERRLRRQRRRHLGLAAVGVDAGPRRIHGMEVTAR